MRQPLIRLGTSAFATDGWEDSFYPGGLPGCDQLSYRAQHSDNVEVDNTLYRMCSSPPAFADPPDTKKPTTEYLP
jgi:uncharacterized protein YecE (DUF72 family)